MSPIANMLVQIKNAQAVGREEIIVPFSRLKNDIAEVLQKEGFLKTVEKKSKKAKKVELPYLSLTLGSMINGIRLVSKPSRRMYAKSTELGKIRNGFGVSVVSTSRGIMTGAQARKDNIGGEVIFEIW